MRKLALNFALAASLALAAAACKEKGPAEKAGEEIDKAMDKVKDAFEEKGPAERAGEAVDDAVEAAKKKAEEAKRRVSNAIDEASRSD